ncbi:MAG: hypothetical protein WCW25_03380 [Patescibacteria group bacterium]|jgi:hypothetical protein
MRKVLIIIIPVVIAGGFIARTSAAEYFIERLSGRIILQVESRGEAWYLNPANLKKYRLGQQPDFFEAIKKAGIGITDADIKKIPIGLIAETGIIDRDADGVPDKLEDALGTNPDNRDSDSDGYDDKTEIINGYSPLDRKKTVLDPIFSKKNAGRIFLQVENKGRAWYVNPLDNKKYLLSDAEDILAVVKRLGLGITNENFSKIVTSSSGAEENHPEEENENNPDCADCENEAERNSPGDVMAGAAKAIRDGDAAEAVSYFTPQTQKLAKYTVDFLDKDGEFTLANMLLNAKLSQSSAEEYTYTNEIFFSLGGYKVKVNYHVKKQPDGKWLLANL